MNKLIIGVLSALLIIGAIIVFFVFREGEADAFDVTFMDHDGVLVEQIEVNKGDSISAPTLAREGYTFVGWYVDETFETRWDFNTDTVNQPLTLYARWEEELVPEMSVQELVQALLGTPFANPELSVNHGLSAPELVGVDESQVLEKYPEIPDAEFHESAIFDFEAIKQAEDLNDTATWDFVIAQAKAVNETESHPVKIHLPNRIIEIVAGTSNTAEGIYALGINGFDGIHIVGGSETVLMIETPLTWRGGLAIMNSKNVQINSVAIDYKYAPVLTGIITSYDEEALTITMDVPESMNEAFMHFQAVPELVETLYSFVEFNMFTGAPKERGNFLIQSQGVFESVSFIENEGDTLHQIVVKFTEGYTDSFKIPRINDRVALGFAMYNNNGIFIHQSETVILEDAGIYTAPGMGLVAMEVHDLFINRLSITLQDDRLMTVTADGLHIVNSTGRIEVTNSIIENSHDDALNIKSGYYYSLTNTDPVTRTITLSMLTESMPLPEVGDVIHVYDRSTFDLKAALTVAAVSGTTSVMELVVEERLAGSIDWTNAVATNVSFSAEFLFRNNIVRDKRNRGILVQVRGAVIENNTFMNVGHGSIQVASSLDIYNEATMPDDIVIRNNKMINNGYLLIEALRGDISVFAIAQGGHVAPSRTIENVTITNNFIANSANTGISLRGLGGDTVAITHNLFYNTSRIFSSSLTEGAIELVNVEDILITDNYNYYTLDSLTYSPIIFSGLTRPDSVHLSQNVNLNFRSADGDVQSFEVAFVNDEDITIDGSVADWEGIGTDIVIDGSSLATGDEIAASSYQNVFHVKTAKIAHSDTGIYFAFDLFDNRLDFKTINDFWTGDVVEIFLSTYLESPNADFMLYKEESDVFQLALAPTWSYWFPQNRTNSRIHENRDEVDVAIITTDEGWAGEVFIPFTLIPDVETMIQQGEGVAIAIVFADSERDDISRTRLQVSNVPHFVEAFKTKTERMPRYIFVETE